jgi:hypothetical protein
MSTPVEALIKCSSYPKAGRWRSTVNNNTTAPAFVDVIRVKARENCDIVSIRIWMKHSDGNYSDWPLISLNKESLLNEQWFVGKVGIKKSIQLRVVNLTSNIEAMRMILLDDSKNNQSEYSYSWLFMDSKALGKKGVVPCHAFVIDSGLLMVRTSQANQSEYNYD